MKKAFSLFIKGMKCIQEGMKCIGGGMNGIAKIIAAAKEGLKAGADAHGIEIVGAGRHIIRLRQRGIGRQM